MQSYALISHLAGSDMDIFLPLFIIATLFVLILKGYALWYSARGGQRWWFVVLLVINVMGILDIVYLLFFSPKPFINTIKSALKKGSSHDSQPTEQEAERE